MDEPIRCWLCGMEYDNSMVRDFTREHDSMQIRILGGWPEPSADGHDHASRPPSPAELLTAGVRVLERIMAAWA